MLEAVYFLYIKCMTKQPEPLNTLISSTDLLTFSIRKQTPTQTYIYIFEKG